MISIARKVLVLSTELLLTPRGALKHSLHVRRNLCSKTDSLVRYGLDKSLANSNSWLILGAACAVRRWTWETHFSRWVSNA